MNERGFQSSKAGRAEGRRRENPPPAMAMDRKALTVSTGTLSSSKAQPSSSRSSQRPMKAIAFQE
jgi:hypothetical protein